MMSELTTEEPPDSLPEIADLLKDGGSVKSVEFFPVVSFVWGLFLPCPPFTVTRR